MSTDKTILTIIARGFQAAADEMARNLIRSAFSAVVREARDCSTALLDAEGRVIGQADMIPMQTAALNGSFRAAADTVDMTDIGPDDFILLNDPYSGGQHLNDIILFTPIFFDKKLIAWSGSTAHHLDIGGGTVGVNVAAIELIQEGIVIPPVRGNIHRDWNGGTIERMIFANIRTPDIGRGDMDAQFAANRIGAERVLDLVRRYGIDHVTEAMSEVLDYSERRMRAAIAEIPDGSWYGEAWIDSNGRNFDAGAVKICVNVTIKGDEAVLDFTGSAEQLPSMFNSPIASSIAAAVTAIRSILADTEMPANDGCNRPLTLIFPEGSVLNPRPGAAVRARGTSGCRALDAVHNALGQALPERTPAQGNNATTAFFLSHTQPGKTAAIHLDVLGGGWGAAKGYDAIHATDHVLSSCRITPAESIEQLHPHVRMESFGLVQNSMGAGQFNGGMGIFRRYRIQSDDVILSLYSDRFRLPPKGSEKGHDASRASLFVVRGDEVIQLDATSSMSLVAGDIVEIRLPGGGGWGDPALRDRAQVEADLVDGYITEEFALEHYGFRLGGSETTAA
ncbi:hydantoinase B/oxoprolinase family protein [Mesorhizobium sp. DCY119]|uniref:hydantoinase B/oxoprolinase family protein n=1 Tax=Mesorhizobium sp. DCY119 TaxID=2108445 RepID=UPI000E6C2801|nr:hydantoinase B/oxoprolinase family protein [Mesorhizobium sp. DCY119]RJG44898.1 hydantoinase B/oxoprolinase family protein [Mesorhizobium sp. DCY119]